MRTKIVQNHIISNPMHHYRFIFFHFILIVVLIIVSDFLDCVIFIVKRIWTLYGICAIQIIVIIIIIIIIIINKALTVQFNPLYHLQQLISTTIVIWKRYDAWSTILKLSFL